MNMKEWKSIEAFDVKQERVRVLGYGSFRDTALVDGKKAKQIVLLDWVEWIGSFSSSCLPFEPTHWMPLPEAPQVQS